MGRSGANIIAHNKWGARTAQLVLDDTNMAACLRRLATLLSNGRPFMQLQCWCAFGAIEATEAAVARAKQTEAAAFRLRRARAASAIYWLERDSETARQRDSERASLAGGISTTSSHNKARPSLFEGFRVVLEALIELT